MEITLDAGQNTINALMEGCEKAGKSMDVFALEMIDLGLRILNSPKQSEDPTQTILIEKCLESNLIAKEALRCVFDQSKVSFKAFDAETVFKHCQIAVKEYLLKIKPHN